VGGRFSVRFRFLFCAGSFPLARIGSGLLVSSGGGVGAGVVGEGCPAVPDLVAFVAFQA
jgi:hypothetical protein